MDRPAKEYININDYYSSQLNKLTDFTEVTVRFNDYDGNSTNHMDLNNESIDIIIEFLTELKNNPTNFKNRSQVHE